MKYWIGINLISNNITFLDEYEGKTPVKLDSKLWDTNQYVSDRGVDLEGNNYLNVSLFFETPLWRNDFKTLIGKLSDYVEFLLPGSRIAITKCWHDELLPNGTPVFTDELEFLEEIV